MKKKYLLWKHGPFQGLYNIEGEITYNIPAESFDPSTKKQGISGIARLRNAQDFLELSIKSHLPYFDEIILADNMSEDNTWKICQVLQQQYPDKIKSIQYPFRTHKLGSEDYKKSRSDSVYDLSYFYNRVLSHVSYKWVAKVDDDHLVIPGVMKHNRECILADKDYQIYYHMLGINVIEKDDGFAIPLKVPYMGLYGDHGFFPISRETYYVHDAWSENFLHHSSIEYLPISFIHLKYLKKDHGRNYQGSYVAFNNSIKDSDCVSLPKQFTSLLSDILLYP